jgi:hypothetical protein
MKYLLLTVPFLAGCETLSLAAADPVVQTAFAKTAQSAVAGDWSGAAVGSVTTIGTLLTVVAAKYLRDAIRKSTPGSVV